MDVSTILIGVIVLLVGGGLVLWIARRDTLKQGWRAFSARLRSWIGASSQHDQERIDHHLTALEQTFEGRLKALEKDSLLSHQLDEFSRIMDRRLQQLEKAEPPGSSGLVDAIARPRSIVRYGLRFTLSDALWSFVGMKTLDDISESQLVSLIQGPFCRMCLKRMAGRTGGKAGTLLPANCRFCGVPWILPDEQEGPPSDIELKRGLYEFLDQKWRASRNP